MFNTQLFFIFIVDHSSW